MSFEVSEGPAGKALTLGGEWTADAFAAALDPTVNRLVLVESEGPPTDLEALAGVPIREVIVADPRITDIEPLTLLGSPLTALALQTGTDTLVDASWFPELELLHADWSIIESWADRSEHLRDLNISGFDAPTLEFLGANPQLERLRMDRSYLETVETFDLFPKLRWLWLQNSKRLTSLEGLRSATAPLEVLCVNKCSRIDRLDGIEACRGLQEIQFAECGSIESLKPLAGLPHLKRIRAYGSTRIADLDLSPLLNLQEVEELALQDRKGYTPSAAELERHFGVPT